MAVQVKNSWKIIATALGLGSLLSGCSPFVQVKDIANDKPGYLAENFNLQSLPSDVQAKLPAANTRPLAFQKLTLRGKIVGKEGATDIDKTFALTILNTNNSGVVQTTNEVTANGVPSAITFNISYRNLVDLKSETAWYNRTMTLVPLVAHDIDTDAFGINDLSEGKTFTIKSASGTTVQLVNFKHHVKTCHADHFYDAAKVNAALTGKAIDVECQLETDGIVMYKDVRTFLSAYGIALTRSFATSTFKSEWTYTDVDADGKKSTASARAAGATGS